MMHFRLVKATLYAVTKWRKTESFCFSRRNFEGVLQSQNFKRVCLTPQTKVLKHNLEYFRKHSNLDLH